jgi:hypothetical protein
VHEVRTPRSLAVLAAGVATALAAAAPAVASEGPTGPPPPPWGLTPPSFQPGPAPPAAAVSSRPAIRHARIAPRRVRRGKRPTLRMSISRAGRVQIVIKRVSRPHRGRVAVKRVSVPAGKVAIRLPRRVHGHALATGRYRVSIVVVSADGSRSRTVTRSFRVRAAN